MKLIYIIIITSVVLFGCSSPIIKPHGYYVEDILYSEIIVLGASKQDVFKSLGSPSVKVEDVDNVWLYIANSKEQKVFAEDVLLAQMVFSFKFDKDDILIEQNTYETNSANNLTQDGMRTSTEKSNYSVIDQVIDAFTRGL